MAKALPSDIVVGISFGLGDLRNNVEAWINYIGGWFYSMRNDDEQDLWWSRPAVTTRALEQSPQDQQQHGQSRSVQRRQRRQRDRDSNAE